MKKIREKIRTHRVEVAFSDSEMKQLEMKKEVYRMNTSDLISWALFEKDLTITVNEDDMSDRLKTLLGEFGKIGSNMNQIAHHLNSGGVLTEGIVLELHESINNLRHLGHELTDQYSKHYGNSQTHIKQKR